MHLLDGGASAGGKRGPPDPRSVEQCYGRRLENVLQIQQSKSQYLWLNGLEKQEPAENGSK